MKTIYFVRHGESEANVGIVGSHKNDREYELTERGREQSRFIAERVRHLDFDVLLASPYVRTRDTAALIAECTSHEPEYSELFIERGAPSELTGAPADDADASELFRKWVASFYEENTRVGDGENFADITKRAGGALRYLENRAENNILVVTHGYFLRVVLAVVMFGSALTPRELKYFIAATKTTNTGISVVGFDERIHAHDVDPERARWRIRVYNDHAHLG